MALAHVAQAQNTPQDFLNAHNSARSQVGVGPMTWDTTVAAYAQNYANQRINDCQLVHSGGPYGENLFWGYGLEYNATYAVNSWVSEKQYYNYATNTFSSGALASSALVGQSSSSATTTQRATSRPSGPTRTILIAYVTKIKFN